MRIFQFISMWPYGDPVDDDDQGGGEIVLSAAWRVTGDAATATGHRRDVLAGAKQAIPGRPTEFVCLVFSYWRDHHQVRER